MRLPMKQDKKSRSCYRGTNEQGKAAASSLLVIHLIKARWGRGGGLGEGNTLAR